MMRLLKTIGVTILIISILSGIIYILSVKSFFNDFRKNLEEDQKSVEVSDTLIETDAGHKFLFKEEYSAGFPESHFYYKLYDVSDGKKFYMNSFVREYTYRINSYLDYSYSNYSFDGKKVDLYFVQKSFLIYKSSSEKYFSSQSIIDSAKFMQEPLKFKYLVPFFREHITDNDVVMAYNSCKFLLDVGDKDSFSTIKKFLEDFCMKCTGNDEMNQLLGRVNNLN